MRRLRAGYGDRVVLDDVSLDIPQEQTTTFIGPGGAGKSTLLRVLHGQPGACTDLWSSGSLRGIGWPSRLLRQKPAVPAGSLREHLAAAGVDPDLSAAAVWSCVPASAEAVRALLDEPMASLSRESARLALLTLLLAEAPPLLFLDEPDADMVEPWTGWIRDLLVSWRGRSTIVLATHHLELARACSDTIFLLVGGKIIESGAAEDLFVRPVQPRTRDFIRMGS